MKATELRDYTIAAYLGKLAERITAPAGGAAAALNAAQAAALLAMAARPVWLADMRPCRAALALAAAGLGRARGAGGGACERLSGSAGGSEGCPW